ncbi:MAG: hypothetical protein OXC62_02225 [Aestuariivita sp.]|nr:hypothetical protein [Aestuariivita sp.]
MLAPLTTLELERNAFAVDVPDTELRRAGLISTVWAWGIANKYDVDAYMRS